MATELFFRGRLALPDRIEPGGLLVRGDRIVEVRGAGASAPAGAAVVDADDGLIAPGFIDLHTHCDSAENGVTRADRRLNKCYLTQGVTTVVTGNCGSGPVDVRAFYAKLEKDGVGTNVAL